MQKGGKTVVWFTPTYSNETYNQLNARLARKGQNEVTTVYRLLVKDSIDEAAVEACRHKDHSEKALLAALKRNSR